MSQAAPDWVAYHARRSPESLALESVDTGARVTWAELEERVARVAGLLTALEVGVGDRIVLLVENDLRVFEMQFACMRVGAVMTPLNWRLAPVELEALCTDAEPSLVVHDGAWAEVGRALAAAAGVGTMSWDCAAAVVDYEDSLAQAKPMAASGERTMDQPTHILYTSGTTGRPKGALVTHGTLFWQWANVSQVSRLSGYGSKYLDPLPLFHAGGLTTLAASIHYGGGCVAVARRFDPEQCAAWLGDPAHRVTHFNSPPIMWEAIAKTRSFASADFSALQHAHIAGSVMPLALFSVWLDRGVGIQQHYGGTEMGPTATALPEPDVARKVGSCGLPVMHTQIRLVGEDGEDAPTGTAGEIWLNGPSITPGYWRRGRDPEVFSGEWFRTGDAAYRDEDGYFFIADRLKDMFKSGGESVFPAEIERILLEMPAVAEVAVVGVPDAKWGEVGAAVVVPASGCTVSLGDLTTQLTGRLARFKLPRSVVIVDALPRNVLGKVDKKIVRSDLVDP